MFKLFGTIFFGTKCYFWQLKLTKMNEYDMVKYWLYWKGILLKKQNNVSVSQEWTLTFPDPFFSY